MTDCPHCYGAIMPEPLPDGRIACDNCGGEWRPADPAEHERLVEAQGAQPPPESGAKGADVSTDDTDRPVIGESITVAVPQYRRYRCAAGHEWEAPMGSWLLYGVPFPSDACAACAFEAMRRAFPGVEVK